MERHGNADERLHGRHASNGTITLAGGVAIATITITPVNDTARREPETVMLTVAPGTGYAAGSPASATGTIADNDVAGPTVSIADATVVEGNNGSRSVTLTITLSAAATGNVTVNYATAASGTGAGHATAGSDYTAKTGSVVFSVGQLSKTITVSISTDRTVEPNETFLVNLTSISGPATIADGQAVVTIQNDDGVLRAGTLSTTSTVSTARITSSADADLLIRSRGSVRVAGSAMPTKKAVKAKVKAKPKKAKVVRKAKPCRMVDAV